VLNGLRRLVEIGAHPVGLDASNIAFLIADHDGIVASVVHRALSGQLIVLMVSLLVCFRTPRQLPFRYGRYANSSIPASGTRTQQ
jgi:hypothetical protein